MAQAFQVLQHRRIRVAQRILSKPLLLLLIWALWISAEYWVFGQHSYVRVHDNAESNFAYRAVVSQIYGDYGFSAWLPNVAGGVDSFTNVALDYSTYDFMPFFLLPDWMAYSLIMFLQRFLAVYFTYRLCKDFLSFRTSTAILAGLFWSLGTWTTNDWTLFDGLGPPLIPLYLYLLELDLKKSGWRKYVWACFIGLLLSYFSFFPLFTPFFIAGSFFWLWIVRGHDIKSLVPVYLCFGLSSFILDIPELYAISLNAPLSGRVGRSLISIPVKEAASTTISGILRYFRTYRVLWVLASIGLLFTRFRDKLLARLSFTAIGIVLGSKILWGISVASRDILGFLSVINFADFGLIAAFIPSVAAAYAIEGINCTGVRVAALRALQDRKQELLSLSLRTLLLFACIGLCIWKSADTKWDILKRLPSDSYAVNFENPDLLRLAGESNNDLFRVATIGVSNASAYSASGDNFYPGYTGAYGFEATDGYLSLYSKRYEDYWGEVIRPLRSVDPGVDRRWKVKPIWIYLYAPFDGSFKDIASIQFDKYYNLNLLSLANTKYLISRWPLENENLTLKNEPMNRTALTDWYKRSRSEKMLSLLKREHPHRALYVYENASVLPRAFLVPQARLFETSDALLDTLRDTPLAEIRRTAFLENGDAATILDRPLGFSRSEVEILDYTPDRIAVSVEADGPGILVMTNNYSPFWKVSVDGIQQMIVPAYHTFQGVYLEAGQHEVVFEYDPPCNLF